MSPTKPKPRITAWSYSRESDYKSCPLKAKYKAVDKLKEPPSESMREGTILHTHAEAYVTGVVGKLEPEVADLRKDFEKTAKGKLPAGLRLFAEEFRDLRKHKARCRVEQELAFTCRWVPTTWFAMHGPDAAWCRIKMDLLREETDEFARVIDYKSGRVDPKHKEQLSLYAIGAFLTLPETVTRIDTELWFLKHGEVIAETFVRPQLDGLKKMWSKRVAKMLADRTFRPTPGDACRWCHFSKSRCGPCRF
jgi:putative RecB family exonuclease